VAKRKKKTTELDYWLADGTRPVFVIDAQRRIRSFNAACQALTGWDAADVIGETCSYVSALEAAGSAALAASLCPPPEVFGGNEATLPAHIIHRQGEAIPRLLHFFPLRGAEGATTAVLGIISQLPPAIPRDESPARQLHAELAALRTALRTRFGPHSLVARSAAMRRVLSQVAIAQESQAGVLLTGPPGAGKTHLARVIHLGSKLKGQSFVPLDCRRLAADEQQRIWDRILDSHSAAGRTRAAAAPLPGSILLTDVEFVPRDLQERLVPALSASHLLRLIATTTRDLAELESDENLRPDFLHLVSPLWIAVPPLSRRADDLPVLAQHFLEEQNRKSARQLEGFDERVWPVLTRYEWPGNLDELAAVIEDAHAHAATSFVHIEDLPHRFHSALDVQALPPPLEGLPLLLDPMLTKVETRLIGLALERSRNNKSKAAELLGINRPRLLRRIEQLGLGDGAASESAQEPTKESDEESPPE
jgi:DNA-binding NtrC family response regulator